MAKPVTHRDVTPFIRFIRQLLLGRKLQNALRYKDNLATRSPPLPILPEGPSHKLASNYYYTRDGRRESKPVEVISKASTLLPLESGEVAKVPAKCVSLPGVQYKWNKSPSSL